jgi:hypothetical protein
LPAHGIHGRLAADLLLLVKKEAQVATGTSLRLA